MKIISRSLTALACSTLLLLLSSCGSVPITGRRQFSLVPDGEILSASATQYKQFISKSQLSSNTTYNAKVTQVG